MSDTPSIEQPFELENRLRSNEATAGEALANATIALVLLEQVLSILAENEPSPHLFFLELRQTAFKRMAPAAANLATRLVADAMIRRLDDVVEIAAAQFRPKD